MNARKLAPPLAGALAVLVLCPVMELVTGSEVVYMLVILIGTFAFWGLQRMPAREIGFRIGRRKCTPPRSSSVSWPWYR